MLAQEPLHVIVVQDEDVNEALYVGGELKCSDGTVYACDIAEFAGDRLIQFSLVNVEDYDSQTEDWPEHFDALVPYLTEPLP
jgi:hypothetical protein